MSSRTLVLLIKAFFKGTKPFSMVLERLSFKAKSTPSKLLKVLVLILLAITFFYFILLLGLNYYSYQQVGMMLKTPYLGLLFASIAAFVLVLLFSLSSVTTTLYQGKDIMMLRALAIDEQSLVVSRLILIYLMHAPLYWFITLPAVVVAFFIDGFSFVYLFGSLLFLLLGPILPLALSVVVSSILIRLTKGRRFRTIQELSSMILLVVFIVGMSASMTRNMGESSLLDFNYEMMIALLKPLLEGIESAVPLLVVQATMPFSLVRMLLFSLTSLLALLIISWYLPRRYSVHLSYLMSNQQNRSKIKKSPVGKRKSILRALIKRELIIIRTHSVFTFELAGELLIPLLLVAIYAATGVMDELSVILEVVGNLSFITEIIFLLFLLVANLCMLSSTSVSRQGSLFVLDRQYPLDAESYVKSKVILHEVLVFVPNLFYVSVGLSLMGQPLIAILYLAPLSFLSIFIVANLHLALDYHRPNLNWSLPQQAMKSNVNGLLGMLISLVFELVLALLLIGPILLGLPGMTGSIIAFILLLILAPISYKLSTAQARLALSR